MPGSPEYLALLHTMIQRTPTTAEPKQGMIESWDWFADAQNHVTLRRLARNAFGYVAELAGLNLETIIENAADLHLRKNAGYAGNSNDPWSNFRLATLFGATAEQGVYIRMSDKWSRIQSLWANPDNDQVGESIIDTVKDLAAYALIADCLITEKHS